MKIASQPLLTAQLEKCLKRLLPETNGLQLQEVEISEEELLLVLKTTEPGCPCPVCGAMTARVQSHYQRTLQDLPWGDLRVRLRLQVRRFYCSQAHCPRRIFTERLPDLAQAYARRTNRLRDALLEVGWVLGGEAGSKLCDKQAKPTAASTVLRLLRRDGTQQLPTPRVLGVDDWAFQRKHPSGTILVDLEKHRVIDLLMGSDEEIFKEWLQAHKGVDVISRDRGASYRLGATKGAPKAKQVLDRWHLLKNWGEVMQKTLGQQTDFLQQAEQQTKQARAKTEVQVAEKHRKAPRRTPAPPSPRHAWQIDMHRQVHELAATGKTQAEIASELHLYCKTVRKYLRMPTFVAHYRGRTSVVEPYRDYLQARWQEGEVMIARLWEEIQAQGFKGTYRNVWAFVRRWPLPEGMTPTASSARPVLTRRGSAGSHTPRQVTWLLLQKAEELREKDAAYRQALFRLSPPLAALSALGQDFVRLVRDRKGEAASSWLERAKKCPYPEVQNFALGLEREFSAFEAALTEPWSTGQVEGQITRLKLLKRQMYGRANLDLLRLRMLHIA
jgi:transposase